MKRTLIALLACMAMMLTFAPVASAATQNPGGCGTDTIVVRLYENSIGDTSDNNDDMWWCSATASDLTGAAFNLPGACNATVHLGDNWNNCIDSAKVWLPNNSLYRVCFYTGANYTGSSITVRGDYSWAHGQRFNLYSPSDQLTSFRWTYALAC